MKHTPFWAIPVIFICVEFGLVAKNRGKKKWALFCLAMILNALLWLSYYYWAGGPKKTVRKAIKAQQEFESY